MLLETFVQLNVLFWHVEHYRIFKILFYILFHLTIYLWEQILCGIKMLIEPEMLLKIVNVRLHSSPIYIYLYKGLLIQLRKIRMNFQSHFYQIIHIVLK